MTNSPDLMPDAEALAHSENLRQHLFDIIAEQGSIPFSRYMQEALYAPGLGYYAAGARKFGASGDFVTAPEISPLFGDCLASQVSQVLSQTGGDVLEFGAGSGRLAADLMNALKRNGSLPERYLILEPSADLRLRQQQLVKEHTGELANRFNWLDSLPEAFCGVMLGNEVLDAFPVERFMVQDGEILQCLVAGDGESFFNEFAPASEELKIAVNTIADDLEAQLTEAALYEVNLYQKPWIQALSASLKQGVVLLLDYGYPRREFYLPERTQGTLRCYYRHQAHDDPFLWPGLQDITSHVDFTALVSDAIEAGLTFEGFTAQAQFLLATHLLKHAEYRSNDSVQKQSEISRQVRQLTMPGAMGESFSAVGFSRDFDDVLIGFSGVEHSHRL